MKKFFLSTLRFFKHFEVALLSVWIGTFLLLCGVGFYVLKDSNVVFTAKYLWSLGGALLFCVVMAVCLSRAATVPMLLVTNILKRAQRMDFRPQPRKVFFLIETQQMMHVLQGVTTGLMSFSKLVPKQVVGNLLASQNVAHLEGNKRVVTVFFSDIADFTSMTEKTPPEDLVAHLSLYFSEMEKVIAKNNGIVDKYIGDAIMALWNAPSKDILHASHACEAALLSQQLLTVLNKKWIAAGRMPLKVRMGLGTGMVVVGNMGSAQRFQYTALGDTVNLASRLESLNKVYGTDILVNASTFQEAKAYFVFRLVDKVAVKGKEKGAHIYQLLCARKNMEACLENPLQTLAEQSAQAFSIYERGDFAKAFLAYQEIEQQHADKAARVLKERALHFLHHPPQAWDGIWHATQK